MNTSIKLKVTARTNYGADLIYPMNPAAKLLAEIAGTRTLTPHALRLARSMGMEVEEIVEAKLSLPIDDATRSAACVAYSSAYDAHNDAYRQYQRAERLFGSGALSDEAYLAERAKWRAATKTYASAFQRYQEAMA